MLMIDNISIEQYPLIMRKPKKSKQKKFPLKLVIATFTTLFFFLYSFYAFYDSLTTPAQGAAYKGLRDLGKAQGIRIGATDAGFGSPSYNNTVRYEFDTIASESRFKFDALHPCPPPEMYTVGNPRYNQSVRNWVTGPNSPQCDIGSAEWNWGPAEAVADYADRNNMQVYGHVFAWHQANPGWITETTLTPAEKRRILMDHIITTMYHFCSSNPGTIYAWDVVNEAIDGEGNLYAGSPWLSAGYDTTPTGNNYIRLAFAWADMARSSTHCSGQDIDLVLNQHNFHDQDTVNGTINIMNAYPLIDELGMQQHIVIYRTTSTDPNTGNSPITTYDNTVASLNANGIEWGLTETDVTINHRDTNGNPLPASQLYSKQATYYAHLVRYCVESPGCKGFTTWGTDDGTSWRWYPPYSEGSVEPDPLLFLDHRESLWSPSKQLCAAPGTITSQTQFCKKQAVYSAVYNALD